MLLVYQSNMIMDLFGLLEYCILSYKLKKLETLYIYKKRRVHLPNITYLKTFVQAHLFFESGESSLTSNNSNLNIAYFPFFGDISYFFFVGLLTSW